MKVGPPIVPFGPVRIVRVPLFLFVDAVFAFDSVAAVGVAVVVLVAVVVVVVVVVVVAVVAVRRFPFQSVQVQSCPGRQSYAFGPVATVSFSHQYLRSMTMPQCHPRDQAT